MPSGPKKRKSKRKNKASVSPPHQSWLRSHMQMLKAPSFGNGTKGKEKHYLAEKEAEGNWDRKKGEEKISFLFKGDEAAAAGEMNSSENEGSRVSALSMEIFQSELKNAQNLDDLQMLALDESRGELQETENLECAVSNGFPEHSLIRDIKVDSSGLLEEKAREDKDGKEVVVDGSFEEAIPSQEVASLPAMEVVETGQAVVDKAEVTPVLEDNASAHGKEEKMMVDVGESMEAPQNDETDAVTPKTEIPHPPMVVRRASVLNCCGLLEVFSAFQH